MTSPIHSDAPFVLRGFGLPPTTPLTLVPGGHVNLSYRLLGETGPLLLQRINPRVFPDAPMVLRTRANVTTHLGRHARAEGLRDLERRVSSQLPAASGALGVQAPDGAWWRMSTWIADTRVLTQVSTPMEAREIGAAFGTFLRRMSDYAGPPLVPAIAGFHDTEASLARFEASVLRDVAGRAGTVSAEIAGIRVARALAGALPFEKLPLRIIHADAKPANVMLDADTGQALAVIDLDTVMPGSWLLDIGDLIRSVSCAVAEDEADALRPVFLEDLFEGLLRGLREGLAPMLLDPMERGLVLVAGSVITHEQAARFLTDYLDGDLYYRTTRPGQNLDRARVQLRLLEAQEAAEPRLSALILECLPEPE